MKTKSGSDEKGSELLAAARILGRIIFGAAVVLGALFILMLLVRLGYSAWVGR